MRQPISAQTSIGPHSKKTEPSNRFLAARNPVFLFQGSEIGITAKP
jgi:hypothetical protein